MSHYRIVLRVVFIVVGLHLATDPTSATWMVVLGWACVATNALDLVLGCAIAALGRDADSP